MNEIRFFLEITPEKYLAYYQGRVRDVVATGVDGRTVRFPAQVLRPYLTHGGIRGEFVLRFDADNRFLEIRRVGDLPASRGGGSR